MKTTLETYAVKNAKYGADWKGQLTYIVLDSMTEQEKHEPTWASHLWAYSQKYNTWMY